MKETCIVCPICRTENRRDATSCFLCSQSLAGAEVIATETPFRAVAPGAHRPTFRLSTIMLVVALIAVSLGVWLEAPGLIVVFAVPAVIALIRTVVVSGGRDSGFKHVGVFLVTFLLVIGVAIAGWVAFCATCLAIMSTGKEELGFDRQVPGLIVGGIAGVAVMVWVTVLLFRRASRKKRGSA